MTKNEGLCCSHSHSRNFVSNNRLFYPKRKNKKTDYIVAIDDNPDSAFFAVRLARKHLRERSLSGF